MASTINATTASGGGIVQTGDSSGNLAIQGDGVTVATATSTGLQINSYSSAASLITSKTTVASTSGTAIDFTGIPSWAKRITVFFSGVSTSATSHILIQIGSGSVTTTGYVSGCSGVSTTTVNSTIGVQSTAGFVIFTNNAAGVLYGSSVISNITSNSWVSSTTMNTNTGQIISISGAGGVSLSGTLDRVRITTVNGTDTFDAGSINIMYE